MRKVLIRLSIVIFLFITPYFIVLSYMNKKIYPYKVERKKTYYLDENRCVTVWFTLIGTYVMPYEYNSFFPPRDNYIIISKPHYAFIEFYWLEESSENVIVRVAPQRALGKIVNKSKQQFEIVDYYEDEQVFKERLFEKTGYLKEGISYIDIDIRENRLVRSK